MCGCAPPAHPNQAPCTICNVLAETQSLPEGIILPIVQKLRLEEAQRLPYPTATKWQNRVSGMLLLLHAGSGPWPAPDWGRGRIPERACSPRHLLGCDLEEQFTV